jgi:RNA polymerase sigma-70 factor (ECF subfamily)
LQFTEDVTEQVMEIPQDDPSLEQQLDDGLLEEKFKSLVWQLPVQYREVLLLKYFQDATFEQIAEILNQPLNTVKSNFYRGKGRLYRLINDKNDGNDKNNKN